MSFEASLVLLAESSKNLLGVVQGNHNWIWIRTLCPFLGLPPGTSQRVQQVTLWNCTHVCFSWTCHVWFGISQASHLPKTLGSLKSFVLFLKT